MAARLRYEDLHDLYRDHGPVLLAYAAAMLGDRSAAEDVLHQVFLKLMGRRDLPSEPRPYLFRAVRNEALNYRRSRSRDVPLEDQPWLAGPGPRVEESLALEKALAELPAEQREVVVMRIWGEMTLEEIAAVLDLPANTAASRYRYGLSKLRATMQASVR
jgi:RNA polymerase sigma-70 factor (ECF subfamily)